MQQDLHSNWGDQHQNKTSNRGQILSAISGQNQGSKVLCLFKITGWNNQEKIQEGIGP